MLYKVTGACYSVCVCVLCAGCGGGGGVRVQWCVV